MSNKIFASTFKTDDFVLALGLEGKSQVVKRGIITYGGYQIIPIYAVNLFNPNLQLIGSSLYYKIQLNENILLRTRLRFNASKDKPLYETSEVNDARVTREKTNEFDIFFEYSSQKGHYARLEVSKDITAHHGIYSEVHLRYAFASFKGEGRQALIQPGLLASIGYGDKSHNSYLYGEGASKSSFNNYEYGLYLTSPKVIEPFWTTFKVSKFGLLNESKLGSYVDEKEGIAVEFIAAFRVW